MAYTLIELQSNKTKTTNSINLCLKALSIIFLCGMYMFCFYLYIYHSGTKDVRTRRNTQHKESKHSDKTFKEDLINQGI